MEQKCGGKIGTWTDQTSPEAKKFKVKTLRRLGFFDQDASFKLDLCESHSNMMLEFATLYSHIKMEEYQ